VGDLKLFRIQKDTVTEIEGESVALERSLQQLIDRHLLTFFGVRFLSSEHATGKTHGGRIDTLGIDENGSPVIVEYKRATNENVINQGLFYLDWLMDHRAEFELLVMEKLGAKAVEEVDWESPRLMCIAGGFTRYDVHAVPQIDHSIELIRYARYSDDLVLFEMVNSPSTPPEKAKLIFEKDKSRDKEKASENTALAKLDKADPEFRDLYHALSAFLTSLGDDVTMKERMFYIAYRRLKNFCCIEIHAPSKELLVFVKVDPSTVELKPGFSRDVRDLGHFGTGDLELRLRTKADLEAAKPLIIKSYEAS
jgi:predicted transport protein